MDERPKFSFRVKGYDLSIEKADGKFVPIHGVAPLGPPFARIEKHIQAHGAAKPIVCKPIPGRDGVEYVPEWFGLTNFG